MFGKLSKPGAPFPINRQEGVAYTEELADGIKLWTKINIMTVPLAILLWAVGVIPAILLSFITLFAVGCPILMTLGFSIGCFQYLRAQECYEIVKTRLTA